MSAQPSSLQAVRPWRTIERRPSRKIKVGAVEVGGDAPIAVQSMTNTLTHDVDATVAQIKRLEDVGADIVRVSVPDPDSSAALRCIVDEPIPLNQGCLAPVDVRIPDGCFLSPSPTAAVVGGNVLTSQRVTDVIFEAFEAAANSQGCMNNFTFGDHSSI